VRNILHKAILEYKSFFIVYAAFIILVGKILATYTKEESFFLVNNIYSTSADVFFKLITHLGDGVLFILILAVLAVYRYRWALLGLLIFTASSLVAQILKLTIFDNVKRPVGHFGNNVDIHFVEGVTRHVNNSFPSGHSTTAFALAVFLLLVFKLKKTGWMIALVAILVAYSRVYLAVHFPIDVYFGSILGVVIGLLLFIYLDDPLKSKFGDKGLLVKK
jgi:membrane-associated phospholipid phosphatase